MLASTLAVKHSLYLELRKSLIELRKKRHLGPRHHMTPQEGFTSETETIEVNGDQMGDELYLISDLGDERSHFLKNMAGFAGGGVHTVTVPSSSRWRFFLN